MTESFNMDHVRDVLRSATGPDGAFTQRGLSAKAGLGRDAVGDIINGRNKNPSATVLRAIADAMGSDVSIFGMMPIDNFTMLGPRLPIIASVAAGVWKEAWEWDQDDWLYFSGRPNMPWPAEERFGLMVEGDSMNLLYPPGSIVECRRYYSDYVIPSGKRIVVRRQRIDGEFETTVKELQRDSDGVEWLVPRSTNPAFQPFRGDRHADDIVHCEIIAIVIGSYRPED